MQITGIYAITARETGKCYVGSARDIVKRWKQHKGLLRAGKHYCDPLQEDWQLVGEGGFEFTILQECSPGSVCKAEQKWGRKLKNVLYNEPIIRSQWFDPDYRIMMSAAAKRRAETVEGRAQLKAARAQRKDYSMMSYARSCRKSRSNGQKLWTPDDDAYLRGHWASDGMVVCATTLVRSPASVRIRANKLNISAKGSEGFRERMRIVALNREAKKRSGM